uniref:Uncharacterized protein n=1 Tax=Macrostomum lignano TaxID=282301 RepID=A0A1I8HUC7_9PLAT
MSTDVGSIPTSDFCTVSSGILGPTGLREVFEVATASKDERDPTSS